MAENDGTGAGADLGTSPDAQKKIDAVKQATELLNALRLQAETKTALAKAEADLRTVTGAAAQQQAAAEQAKALAEAQSQAALAKYIGDVKAGPYTGSVTANATAGTEEAQLLAAQAIREAASRVAVAVRDLKTVFYVFSTSQMPTFQRLTSYRFRVQVLRQAFAAVEVTAPGKGKPQGLIRPNLLTPGEASAGLDAFSKLLGFFKTDYAVGGTEVKLEESLLLNAVAGQLAREQTREISGADGKPGTETLPGREVHLSELYEPKADDVVAGEVRTELTALFVLRREAEAKLEELRSQQVSGQESGRDSGGGSGAGGGHSDLGIKEKADQLAAVIALFDGFVASLSTPDGSGTAPVASLAQESAIHAALRTDAAVLLLKLESSGGGYLIKKNLFTGLGRMPMYTMGGATVSYVLLEGVSGRVLAGDVVPVYGGFVRTDKLRDTLR